MTFTKKNNFSTENIGVLLVIILAANILLIFFSDGISGNDFWWHVKVGEWICENGKIPTRDIFSWYGIEQELDWTAHEWLSDVIYYLIHNTFGDAGIFVFCILAAFLMIILLLVQVKGYFKENVLLGTIYFILLSIVSTLFFYGRPHVFSFFLLFFELKVLYEFIGKPNTKKIYWLPVIGCLWSNLHGGSSNLAYILCLVFLVAAICNFKFGRVYSNRLEKGAICKLFGMSVVTFFSLFLNPIGSKVILFPYTSIGDKLMMSTISEWQAPDAKDFGTLIFYFVPIIIMTIGIVTEEKEVRLIDILVMGVFLYLFFRSSRFIMLWYIAAGFYAFPYLPKCRLKEVITRVEKIVLGVGLFVLLIPFVSGIYNIAQMQEEEYISRTMSEEAIDAVRKYSTDRMFNDYDLGEALIYNDIPVFFDARADMYLQENIYADAISLMSLKQMNNDANTQYVDVEAFIEKYQFNSMLIMKTRALYTYILLHEERFECMYEDDTLAYFKIVE